MLREAGVFSEQLRQCEGEIRSIKDATESLLSTVRGVLSAPLPRTYDDAGGGAAAPSATRPRAIGGPDADLDGLREVGREAGRRLESEVLAPMGRWNQAYDLVRGRMVKLEALRLEVDSRRRTVARLGKKVDAQRARGGTGRPLLLGGSRASSEAELEGAIRVLQHKEAKLAACRVSFREHETLVFHQLVNLIRDAVWLKSYLSAVLQVQADTFDRSNQCLGALRAPALPAPGADADRMPHELAGIGNGNGGGGGGSAVRALEASSDLGDPRAEYQDFDSRDGDAYRRERHHRHHHHAQRGTRLDAPADDPRAYYDDNGQGPDSYALAPNGAPVPRSLALRLGPGGGAGDAVLPPPPAGGAGAQMAGARNVWSSWDPRPEDDGTVDPPEAAPESPDGYAPAALYAPGRGGGAEPAPHGYGRRGAAAGGGPLGRGTDDDADGGRGDAYYSNDDYGTQRYADSQPSERGGGRRAARNLDAEDAYGRAGGQRDAPAQAPAPRQAGARARGATYEGSYAPDVAPSHAAAYGYDKRALASERSEDLYPEARIPAGRTRGATAAAGGRDARRTKAYPTGRDVDEDVLYGSGLQAAYASGGGDYRSGRRGWD